MQANLCSKIVNLLQIGIKVNVLVRNKVRLMSILVFHSKARCGKIKKNKKTGKMKRKKDEGDNMKVKGTGFILGMTQPFLEMVGLSICS